MLAKWLNAKARILILDHPTRGLDVGAKEEVYELVRAVTAEGIAVILTSDTLEETIGLSHTRAGHARRRRHASGRRRRRAQAAADRPHRAHGLARCRLSLTRPSVRPPPAVAARRRPAGPAWSGSASSSRASSRPAALLQLADDTVTLFVLAAGVTFVIMLGGIDLSIQAMASLASVIVALTITRLGYGSFVLAIARRRCWPAAARASPTSS